MNKEKFIGDISQIKEHYTNWLNIQGINPEQDALLKRKRGYELEKIIYSILHNEQLNPSTGLEPEGEQIDGSFIYENFPFLLEAKWHAKPAEASKIYAFKGKVDGKFHLVSGIFISLSDYSENASQALTIGKTANVILFGKQDIEAIILHGISFKEVLNFKILQASFYGLLYVPFSTKVITMKSEKTIQEIIIDNIKPANELTRQVLLVSPNPDLISLFVNNTLEKLELPNDIKFLQMAYVSTDPEAATLKNIHRMLFSLKEFNSYSGIIILYPANNEIFKNDPDDFFTLNNLLIKAGLKKGAMTVYTLDGILNDTMNFNLLGYLKDQ